MTVKNIGNKLIGFGSVDLFPGDIKKLPEDYEGNETIKTYVELGFVEIVKEPKPAKAVKVEKKAKEAEAPTE